MHDEGHELSPGTVLIQTVGIRCVCSPCSDRILRLLRKVHPPTALRLRARSGGHSGLGCALSSHVP